MICSFWPPPFWGGGALAPSASRLTGLVLRARWRNQLGQRRAAEFERFDVGGLVIRHLQLPTPIDNPNPFEGQRPDRFVVFIAALALLVIVGARPTRPVQRTLREFVKALADKLRTGIPALDQLRLATALGHRRHATIALHFAGVGVTPAIAAEGGQQARRQGFARAGQRAEDLRVGVLGIKVLNLPI